jgi:DNA polymerase-4
VISITNYILHIDVNSAYLSWTAAYRLQQGYELDLRTVPAVVGGSEKSRHGIVLAKSMPAKKFNIITGESIRDAYQKCPKLICVAPNYDLYMKASAAMVEIIREYSPKVQRFSIDECFVDYNDLATGRHAIDIAKEIRKRMWDELGFTVNIGVSTNKILAKMGSDFQKPDRVHTLFPNEIQAKMWPLPVGDLFMVGSRTEAKLKGLGINTIGELAQTDVALLSAHLKSHGYLVHAYANGIDHSPVRKSNREIVKGMGNSTTVRFNVEKREDANLVLLSLAESVGMRLRQASVCAGLVSVSIRSTEFTGGGHQRKISVTTDSTTYIHKIAMQLFDEMWDGQLIRKLGLRVSDLYSNDYVQLSLLEEFDFERQKALDDTVDKIRGKYGSSAIHRASFLHSGLRPVTGGIQDDGEDEYPIMTCIL